MIATFWVRTRCVLDPPRGSGHSRSHKRTGHDLLLANLLANFLGRRAFFLSVGRVKGAEKWHRSSETAERIFIGGDHEVDGYCRRRCGLVRPNTRANV